MDRDLAMTAVDLTRLPDDAAEERAILVELSGGPTPVTGPSRRWLLALAAAASIVSFGFAGAIVVPRAHPPGIDATMASGAAPVSHASTSLPPANADTRPALALVVPPLSVRLTDGLVPVSLSATPRAQVHVSVRVGDAVIGWRNVVLGSDGRWTGSIKVFAPRVQLPAMVTATAIVEHESTTTRATVVLDSGVQVALWEAAVAWPSAGTALVTFRASAPLTVRRIDVLVADGNDRPLESMAVAPRVDPEQPGSVGGREFGLGSVAGNITIRRPPTGSFFLHLSWHDPTTGGTSKLQRVLGPADESGTRMGLTRH